MSIPSPLAIVGVAAALVVRTAEVSWRWLCAAFETVAESFVAVGELAERCCQPTVRAYRKRRRKHHVADLPPNLRELDEKMHRVMQSFGRTGQ